MAQFQIDHPNSAICMIQNQLPFIDTKYNLTRHPNIDLTVDGKLGNKLSYSHKFTPTDLGLPEICCVMGDYDLDSEIAVIDCRELNVTEVEGFTGNNEDDED